MKAEGDLGSWEGSVRSPSAIIQDLRVPVGEPRERLESEGSSAHGKEALGEACCPHIASLPSPVVLL